MKKYTINYDLCTPGQNYQRLYEALGALHAQRVLESTWVLRGDYKAASLRDHLAQYIDHNDRLLVVEIADWASWNTKININTL